jgi:hypothetical protein
MLKYLLILATLLPISVFAQDKKDDLITITPTDTTNLYDQAIALFAEEKIKLSKPSNNRRNFISTEFFRVKNYRNPIYFNLRILEGKILLFGYFVYDGQERLSKYVFEPGWEEMDRIAKKLGTVTYGRVNW